MRRCLLIILLFFAGCGGSSSPSVDYKVALDPAFSSLSLQGRNMSLRAFTIELLEAIGKEQNVKIAIYDRSWDNLLWGLQNRDFNGIVSTMQPYLFYEKLYDFSQIYLMTGPTLVVPAAANIESLADMNGKEVAIQRGSNTALILEKYPGIIQRTYDSVPQSLIDVATGAIDGTVLDILTAAAYCRDLHQGMLKIALPPLNAEGLRLVSLHGQSPELIRLFNNGLKKLQENGEYSKLVQKWGLGE